MQDVVLKGMMMDYRSSEAYKTLRTNIEFSGADKKVIVLTSCTAGEGKSTVSLAVAASLAEGGKKVLFIDADLRKSVLAGRHRIGKNIKGLSHFLSGQAKFEDVLVKTSEPRLYAIFAGIIPPNPAELLESKTFREFPSKLAFAVGKDIAGKVVVSDIAKMPHMLIAGSTGSGKSVCINTLIMSILYKAKPDEVKLILVDPKVVELSVYNGIPHLLIPVVTDPKQASGALHWGVAEMENRYQKFADWNVRDLKGYNKKVEEQRKKGDPDAPERLPQIVIIVDELADLMMVAPGEVEESICRLAQLARAAGIHLIIATQRPHDRGGEAARQGRYAFLPAGLSQAGACPGGIRVGRGSLRRGGFPEKPGHRKCV